MVIQVKLKAYSKHYLNKCIDRIILKFRLKENLYITGPAYLPTKIKKFTVNKSPYIDKESRDQFELRLHQRIIKIWDKENTYLVTTFFKNKFKEGVFFQVKIFK